MKRLIQLNYVEQFQCICQQLFYALLKPFFYVFPGIQLWIFLCFALYLFASSLKHFNIWLTLLSNCFIFQEIWGFVNTMNKKRNLTWLDFCLMRAFCKISFYNSLIIIFFGRKIFVSFFFFFCFFSIFSINCLVDFKNIRISSI